MKRLLFVWRILLVVLALLVAWRILVLGAGAHYVRLAGQGDAAASAKLAESGGSRPEVAYNQAVSILEQDPAGAAVLLKRAYAENPADAAPLLALAQIAQDAGDQEQAAALVATASQLMPANPDIQQGVGNYWAKKGDLVTALGHWSQALEAYPEASSELFPILLQLVEEPQTRGAFQFLAASPPSWWEQFFAETARRALNLETVRTLYGYRRAASRAPITRQERGLYIRRLQKEGKIPEAYLVWVNGLDAIERLHLGIINNGGFEVEPSSSGFDWHLKPDDHMIATTGATVGADGGKALHLMFRNMEKRFRHVYQALFLDAGSYRVEGMVRTDSLDSKGGVKWIVRCLDADNSGLGESERFLGSSEWREFGFTVQVPDGCMAQEIRLVSAGTRGFERKMTGGIWFDRMSMRKAGDSGGKMTSARRGEGKMHGEGGGASSGRTSSALELRTGEVFRLHPSVTESLDSYEQRN